MKIQDIQENVKKFPSFDWLRDPRNFIDVNAFLFTFETFIDVGMVFNSG